MPFRAVLFDFGQTLFQAPDAAALLVEAGVEPGLAQQLWSEIWARALTPEELAKGRDLSEEAHPAIGWSSSAPPNRTRPASPRAFTTR